MGVRISMVCSGFEPHDYRNSRIVVVCRLDTLGSADALLRVVNRRKNNTQLFLLRSQVIRPLPEGTRS